ncbi:ubiquitin-conjugating enzyme 20 [Actinidia rufa]|uniref:Ubiquitin-conjugating enzyme 20 n=1 Tax=Actinidia rufa TaxID=165716 RepID=A0A7J0G2E5_9ERIC|nr:ubiquitin-conjugating enzyme 20 [Actinidia rufa]
MTTINNRHQDGNTPVANSAIPSSNKPISVVKSVDTESVVRISAFPEDDELFNWKGTISGSKDTVFEGTDYKLSLLLLGMWSNLFAVLKLLLRADLGFCSCCYVQSRWFCFQLSCF